MNGKWEGQSDEHGQPEKEMKMRVIDMNGDSRRAAPRKADGRRTAKEEAEKKEIPPSPPIGKKENKKKET